MSRRSETEGVAGFRPGAGSRTSGSRFVRFGRGYQRFRLPNGEEGLTQIEGRPGNRFLGHFLFHFLFHVLGSGSALNAERA